MLITILAVSALAEPPQAEVLAGWAGTPAANYSYLTVQPALAHSEVANLSAKVTVSHLHLAWHDGVDLTRVDAPGVSAGPVVTFTPGPLSIGLGLALSARHATTRITDSPNDHQLTLDGSLSADLYWRPAERASIYAQSSFAAAGRSVWARAGATFPVIPGPVSLWLGFEGTTSGPFPTLRTDVGPVAEVPVRALHASFSVRAATPVQDPSLDHTTFGVGAYWAF